MRILVTNDDGLHADGLYHLASVARQFGEVKVVAPDRERSACAHGMTLREPLRVKPAPFHLPILEPDLIPSTRDLRPGHPAGLAAASHSEPIASIAYEDLEAYEVSGLPVDCVNVGLSVAWPDGCDLVLSGINNGPNLGFDVTYSGTVAGAMEGAINGIWSIAVSMAHFVLDAPYHYETGSRWLAENLEMLLELPRKPLTFLNVNVPAIAYPELNGHRFVGMGQRVYQDRVEERLDPWGRPYYWQGGAVVMDVEQPGTDVHAVTNGIVAITPITLDWTDHAYLDSLP